MPSPPDPPLQAAVQVLRDPATIRARCRAITAHVSAGDSPHFTVERGALDAVADRVAALTRRRFPTLAVPYHSRWRHFEAGGVDRRAELDAALAGRDAAALARARVDLALVSVLLDAGAGPAWRYVESTAPPPAPPAPPASLVAGRTFRRSEGLGVASFRAFMAGCFSSNAAEPWRVDAAALLALDEATLAAAFQAGPANPLTGLAGRVKLLQRLGSALRDQPAWFGPQGRPGGLVDALMHQARAGEGDPHQLGAGRLLTVLLDTLSGIWPSGRHLDGVPLGDVWPHAAAGGEGCSAGWVPFHKLSQWLTYSLLEPFEWAGFDVTGLEALTGLPEYRNGGLLLDAGVVRPRDARIAERLLSPADAWVIEWRALTVTLLDELAPRVRQRLGPDAAALPLACLLEGGTWAAGRQIAAERRADGGPPVRIDSDGTVF